MPDITVAPSLVPQDGAHPRGYFVRMRGGTHKKWFMSLLDAAQYVKDMDSKRCPVLFVPGCDKWIAFVALGDGFIRYDAADLPFSAVRREPGRTSLDTSLDPSLSLSLSASA